MTIGDSLGPEGKQSDLVGVRGWLAFLCFSLIVANPFANFLEIVRFSRQFSSESIFVIVLDLGLAGLSIFAGVGLIKLHSYGVRLAKIFYFVMLALGLLGTVASIAGSTTPEEFFNAVRTATVALAWILYLYRSERVRVTYERAGVTDVSDVFR